jgi:hypothetical protein
MLLRTITLAFVAALFVLIVVILLPAQESQVRTIHVFVALADNQNQGIVPVPARLGNGFDPEHNLYWGAAAGVKTFFARSSDWALLHCAAKPYPAVLERCVFKHKDSEIYLVADAYQGDQIKQAILDFFDAAAGGKAEIISVPAGARAIEIPVRAGSSLVAYVGHDGLMDFSLPSVPHQRDRAHREAIILACASRQYFGDALKSSGSYPLLWTTNLMAPEAYTLKAALDGWINHESNDQIRERAAIAYDKYQKCGLRGARRLFATGW